MNHTNPNALITDSALLDFSHPLSIRRIILFLALAFLLRKQLSSAALSIPAVILALSHELRLEARDGICTTKYSVLALLIPWLATFCYRLVIRRRQLHNMPGVPHHSILGHLPTVTKETMKLPQDIHSHVLMDVLAEKYDLRKYGLFYLDSYPIMSEPMIVVIDPDVAAQVTQGKKSWSKHPSVEQDFGQVIGPRGLFFKEDEEWKELRTMFNPGFSQANLMALVPTLVEEGEIFVSRLSTIAAGDGFIKSMDSMAAALTVDVIGKVLFGIKWNTQTRTSPNTLVMSIVEISRLAKSLSNLSPERFNVPRILREIYYEYVGNTAITKTLRSKWSQLVASPEEARESHFIFDIAMNKYSKRGGKLDGNISNDFLKVMRDNVKTFIFAGHDTTSAVITYAFYELSRHPEALKELRAEHDSVLGSNANEAGQSLKNNPQLTNSLPYTTAVIREVMRLYLPASTMRTPPKGAHLTGRDGKSYPAEGCGVWVSNYSIMKDSSIFPSPNTFQPLRFIPERSPFPPIPKDAYRPFEKGSRDCIGQELAMLESRVTLALTVRKFDFREAYQELDMRLGRKTPPEFESLKDVGGRAYQILFTTAKPKDGLPMWVTERDVKK